MSGDLTMGGYYAIIPAQVLSDPHLRPRTKLLYGEIVRLSAASGFCYAKNSYLLRVCTYIDAKTGAENSITERTLQSMLSELKDQGHISIDNGPIPHGNGDSQFGRRIFIGQALSSTENRGEENFTPRKNLHPMGEKNFTPYISLKNKKEDPPISPTKKTPKDPPEVTSAIFEYIGDDPEFQAAFDGFLEMRRKIKKPMLTERAAHILINKLRANRTSRETQIAMLDKATECNWTTVYPPKPNEVSDKLKRENGGRFL